MNWKKLFPVGDILTASDRQELERLEAGTSELRELEARIDRDWTEANNRIDRIRDLAAMLCTRPKDTELYRRLEVAACMPSHPASGHQHKEAALGAIRAAIADKMLPEVPVVRRVLSRALDAAERELAKQEKKEREAAEAEDFNYSPSGRVLSLQQRVLELRNAVAARYSIEGAVQGPGGWRQRLAEWL
ncbi:MAG: hypothetical protein EBT03_07955 [Betaproteobacteria bacterium]|nr:hypothetical protein [Betaproteobacteria bacterium]NCA17029.1 hypothetical protein [Betaproteobacteria bacterium]